MEKVIAYYGLSAFVSINILDILDERVYYRINDGKKHFSKVYYNNSGEPYFVDRVKTNSRIYLSECLRTNI